MAEDYRDKDEGRSPCSLRAASGFSGVQAGKRHGVIEKVTVGSGRWDPDLLGPREAAGKLPAVDWP